jgi:hypothetical protein
MDIPAFLDGVPINRLLAFTGVMFFLFTGAVAWEHEQVRELGYAAFKFNCGHYPNQQNLIGLWWNKTNQSWQTVPQWPPLDGNSSEGWQYYANPN